MLKECKVYGGKTTIRFDDERHIFYNEKGVPLISVTSITGIVDKSAPLMYWAVNKSIDFLTQNWNEDTPYTKQQILDLLSEASKQHTKFKKEAADIGTQIHDWISKKITGKNPEMPEDEKVINGITAFLKFQKEHGLKWIESERVVYSKKNQYAGFLDAIATEKDSEDLILVDFKSSNGIYEEMMFQVAGYQIAYEEETKKKIARKMIIRFGKDSGEFEYQELDNTNKDQKAFLACLAVKNRLKELSKR